MSSRPDDDGHPHVDQETQLVPGGDSGRVVPGTPASHQLTPAIRSPRRGNPASTASGQEQLRQTPSASPIPRADRTALTGKRLTEAARPGQPVTTGNFNRDRIRAQTQIGRASCREIAEAP